MGKAKQKITKLNTLVYISVYQKKKVKQGKYTITHINKNGSVTKYGVSRTGNRFKQTIIKIKTENELVKLFEKAKSEKKYKKVNVTFKVVQYTGKYLKKRDKIIEGQTYNVQFYNIDRIKKRTEKTKKIFYTTNYRPILRDILNREEKYNNQTLAHDLKNRRLLGESKERRKEIKNQQSKKRGKKDGKGRKNSDKKTVVKSIKKTVKKNRGRK